MEYIYQVFSADESIYTFISRSGSFELAIEGVQNFLLAIFSALYNIGLTTVTTEGGQINVDLTNYDFFKFFGLIGFCCITALVVITKYRKSAKNDKQEYEYEIDKTQLKLAAIREKQILLIKEFEKSANRLNDIAEQLENKRQLLVNIKQLAEMTNSENSIAPDIRSKFSKIARNIQYSFHVDQEWHHFRSYFENANEKFFSNLKERFPALSPNDYKLCVLYKIDSDHERVASIMEISPESARVMKHRLKKKLELPLNACLSEFLRGFDTEATKNVGSHSNLITLAQNP